MLQQSDNKRITLGLNAIIKNSSFPYPDKSSIYPMGLAEILMDKLLLIVIIQEGLPFDLFTIIKENTPFRESEWARFLGLSSKSIQRYKRENKKFKPLQTEKILELTEVSQLGLDVFASMDKFQLWLNTPNFALGRLAPIKLLNDSYGKELVMTELTRVDHGIFV